jgi:ADP-ribosylglycohydrolase
MSAPIPLPADFEERVYAGVLGKIIGVYLGRPFEGWSYDRIMSELGEINYYVHEQLNKPLIVTDDDISGTFTFIRALADYGNARDITPAQIGQTWLNYLINQRTILWWGGLGNSTEHTAYLRLMDGIQAPQSGSIELNSKVVAEQIGAQIFIDGWAMVAPGDPEYAADLARRAGSVSHDGEAIYGAQVLAAMEAQAFVESDLNALLDVGVSLIPVDSVIARMIAELRELRTNEPDWHVALAWLQENYGYHIYGGNCHMVPNHGLMILSLLYGDDNFQKTMMIVNTGGWDTDCNSGNIGCLMGIKNGLAGLETGPDYRGPVADRLYLPTADGGRAVTDALIETYHLVNSARGLQGLDPVAPKQGARFNFNLPGAVQGFLADESVDAQGTLTLENVAGHSATGTRSLALRYSGVATGRTARAGTATFLTPEAAKMPGYGLICSPTLYAGQTVRARVEADATNSGPVRCNLYIRIYGAGDECLIRQGPTIRLQPGAGNVLVWTLDPTDGDPIAEIGIEIHSGERADGTLYLDTLTWDGAPTITLNKPEHDGTMWRQAWVNGVDDFWTWTELRVIQNSGTGLVIQGTGDWKDYEVSAEINPHLIKRGGLAARVQGMRRYYALLLCAGQKLCLVKALDGDTILAETDFTWTYDEPYALTLRVAGNRIIASVDGAQLFDVIDTDRPLTAGGIALVIDEGRLSAADVTVKPAE